MRTRTRPHRNVTSPCSLSRRAGEGRGEGGSEAADGPAPQPFDLDDDTAYRNWRARKLAQRPANAAAITVDVADPRALKPAERRALLDGIARANVAIYRSPVLDEDPRLPAALGAQLGLVRLDANWLADEDGISHIRVGGASDGHGGFIPYTSQPIRWHTDGYYHPQQRRIHGMILHCVRAAAQGGENRLLDPELAYIALRDESPALVAALMQSDAMTIPARADADGVARAAQSGPVFAVEHGALHMRYTARTRSIEWSAEARVQEAVRRLAALLAGDMPGLLRVRLSAGMGIVGHNVLHDRSGFVDDANHPRLLYRARFLCRVDLRSPAPD